jgi:hypothetical protein
LLGDFSLGASGGGPDAAVEGGGASDGGGHPQGDTDGATGDGTMVSDGVAPGDGAAVDGSTSTDASDSAAPPGCTGPSALHCGAYSSCVTGPACMCVTGYVNGSDAGAVDGGDDAGMASDDGGAACAWAGLPLDPALDDTPPNAWTILNATFSPTVSTSGQLDPGSVSFTQDQMCPAASSGLGSVQQSFTMPTYAESQPFGLRLSGQAVCIGEDCGSQGIGFDMNGGYLAESLGGTLSPLVLCLGERAYGGEVTLTLTPWADDCGDNSVSYSALLDHVDIEPVSGCPVPGVITNADFEATTGWAVSSPTTGTCSSSAAIANGDGTAGTRGGMVVSTCEGSTASVSEGLSIQDTEIPNLALQMDFNNTGSDVAAGLDLSFGGHSLGNMAGAGERTGKICIPAWAKGLADTLSIDIPYQGDGYHGGGSYEDRSFTFDNLLWVSDPTCPAAALIIDPGFERTDSGRGWQLGVAHEFNSVPTAAIGADPSAHGGANSLHLGVTLGGEAAFAQTTVTIPPADATGGPVLTIWYKLTASTQEFINSPFGNLAPATAWTQASVCLNPHAVGHAFDVALILEASGTVNAALTPVIDAYFDDVGLATSAACPSN